MASRGRKGLVACLLATSMLGVALSAGEAPPPDLNRFLAGAKTDLERARRLHAAAQGLKDNQPHRVAFLSASLDYALKSAAAPVSLKVAEESLDLAQACLRELEAGAPARRREWTHSAAEMYRLMFRRAREPEKKEEAGTKLVGALLSEGALCEQAHDWKEAIAVYREASALASSLRLESCKPASDLLARALHRHSAADMADRLTRTLKGSPADTASRAQLVRILIADLDDPTAAARHMTADVGEPWRTCVPQAVRPIPETAKPVCKEMGDWYHSEIAKSVEGKPCIEEPLLSRAKSYYERFLELPPAGSAGTADVTVALSQVNSRLREIAVRGTFLEDGASGPRRLYEVPGKLTWKRVPASGVVWGGFRLVNVTKGHDQKAVLKFIAKGDLAKEQGGRKLEVATPNGDNVLEGGGDHGNATYYVFYLGTNYPQEVSFDLKYAQFGDATVFFDFRQIADIPDNPKSDTRAALRARLSKGMHVLVVRYTNGWAARWLSLRACGKGVYNGVLSPEGPAGMIDTRCE